MMPDDDDDDDDNIYIIVRLQLYRNQNDSVNYRQNCI